MVLHPHPHKELPPSTVTLVTAKSACLFSYLSVPLESQLSEDSKHIPLDTHRAPAQKALNQ